MNGYMHIQIPLMFVASTLVLLFNYLVYAKNRNSKVNLFFAIFGISISFWLLSFARGYAHTELLQKIFWFKIGYVGIIFIPINFYAFIYFLLGRNKDFILVVTNYLIGVIFVVIHFSNHPLVIGLYKYPWGYYPNTFTPIHIIFLVYFISLFTISNILMGLYLISKSQHLTKIHRFRIKYALVGSIVGSFATVDFIGSYGKNFPPIGFIFMFLYPAIFTYAILRYRLMDVTLVVTRTSIFIFVYSLVLGIPFIFAFLMKQQFVDLLGIDYWWLMPLISSTLLATVGPFLYLFIQKRAEDRLLQEQRRYQTTLRQASLGMGRIKEINRLVNLIVHIVTRTVRIEHCIIYLRDVPDKKYKMRACRSQKTRFQPAESLDFNSAIIEYLTKTHRPILYDEIKQQTQDNGDLHLARLEAEMAKLEAVLIIPSFIDEDMLAVIVLGNKFSNKLYSNDDLVVFSILASQAALAIENAQFYEDVRMTHEQLFKAEKMATIGTMADGLSHQINNRLHALGFIAGDALDTIRLKRDLPMSSEVKEVLIDIEHALNRIEDNVAQGGEIVQGLLKYTRKGESGYSEIELDNLINAVMEMAQFKIKPGEMVVHRDYGPDVPKIYGNFTQLQEVFFNLIDNAYDAMMQRKVESPDPSYKPTIKISAQRKDAGSIEIVIQDNGMGIKEDDKTKLFTPFFTTKLSSKKGTGLGLYVIQKLIEESHKGKVSYSSRYREGTRVVILLNTVNSK